MTTKLFSHNNDNGVISHDGHFLLTCEGTHHSRRNLHLSDLTSGERVRTFTITASDPHTRFFSYAIANNRSFVAGACDDNIYLWNTYSGKLMTTLVIGQGLGIYCCCIFLNDTRITAGGLCDKMRVWEVNLEKNQYSCLYVLTVGVLHDLLVSADSARIITVSKRTRVWNSVTGECLQIFDSRFRCAMSVDNDQCLGSINTGSGEIKLWNVTTGECIKTIAGSEPRRLQIICYLSSKRFVLRGLREVSAWDLQTDTNIYTLSFEEDEIKYITVSADGEYLFIGRSGKDSKFVHLKDSKVLLNEVYSLETGKLVEETVQRKKSLFKDLFTTKILQSILCYYIANLYLEKKFVYTLIFFDIFVIKRLTLYQESMLSRIQFKDLFTTETLKSIIIYLFWSFFFENKFVTIILFLDFFCRIKWSEGAPDYYL